MGFKSGDWLALCDVCARRFYASQLKKRWDNLLVCSEDWETRHPQDFVRGTGPDPKPLPWTRPDNDGIESTVVINCDGQHLVDVPYLIEADLTIGKGYTLTPAVGVIIEDGATVTVFCSWIIE
jgi:hypothetical protein